MARTRAKLRAKARRRLLAKSADRERGTANPNRIQLEATVSLQAAAGDGKSVPTFTVAAYNGGTIRPAWFGHNDRPTVIDLSGLKTVEPIPVLLDHWASDIVGQTSSVTIDESSLRIEGFVTGSVEEDGPARHVVTHAKNGFVWRASPGIEPRRVEKVEAGTSVSVNGQDFDGPLYVVREGMLDEVSFLSLAADRSTSVQIAARAAQEITDMKFNEWLKALSFDDPDGLSEAQHDKLKAKYDAEQAGDGPVQGSGAGVVPPRKTGSGHGSAKPPPKSDLLAEAKALKARKAGIELLMTEGACENPDAIEFIEAEGAKALEDETVTVQDFETLLLRESSRCLRMDPRPAPSGGRRDRPVEELEIVAALCRSSGMSSKVLEAEFKPRILEAADKRWRHGLSLSDMLEFTAKAHGYSGRFRHNPAEVLAHSMPSPVMRAQAGPSTYDVSGIVGGVLERSVRDYFSTVDMAAMNRIAATRPTRDFRLVESFALTSEMQFAQVAPSGELTHATFGEKRYTNQAATYGRLITIDRQTLINDDIGALASIARLLGRGGALALLHKFWTIFINNSTFFTAAQGNYDDGADTALALSSLTLAKTLFNKLTDPEGKPMNVTPRILLVPPELEAAAQTILQSQLVVIRGDDELTLGNANIHAGTLDLAMARELSLSTYTGYSVVSWYLLGAPTDVPVIEIAYLNGVDRPTVENAQADFNILGISLRGFFDFGVALQEFRGGVRMKGEA